MAIRMFVNDDAAEGGRRLLSVEQRMSNRNRDDIAESLHSPASHFVVAPSYSRDETVMMVPDGVIMQLFHNAAEGDGWASDQDGDTTIAGALELSTDYDGDFVFAVEGLQKHALGESVAAQEDVYLSVASFRPPRKPDEERLRRAYDKTPRQKLAGPGCAIRTSSAGIGRRTGSL